MDLKEFFSHTARELKKEEIAGILGPDEETYAQLVELAFSGEMPECWRATWIMDYLAELHEWIAEPHIDRIWSEIPKNHPVGVTRSALRLLCRYNIPEKYQGIATDLCLNWMVQEAVPVAIKVFSMEILLKIAKIYPEMAPEFVEIILQQAENNSGGYKARAQHVVKAMKQLQT